MKKPFLALAILAFACVSCAPRKAKPLPQRSELLTRLLSDAHSVIVVDDKDPHLITNETDQVLEGFPMVTIGSVTSRQEVANLTSALTETGMHGDSGVCFCGALPGLIFLNAKGKPLVSTLVHVHNNHVILSTNLVLLGNQIYSVHPTGEWFTCESPLPSGDNPKYGTLALDVVKRIWPDECVRRELEGCEDLIKAHKEAEAQKEDDERLQRLLKL